MILFPHCLEIICSRADKTESSKIFLNMTFEKITINFIPNNVKTLDLTCVSFCVQLIPMLMPISSKELKAHEIFNRSHLNSKLRLGPVFFHSSPFLHFAYTIYLKRICLISRGKNTNYIHITLYSYVYVYNFYQQYFLNSFISQNIYPPTQSFREFKWQ